MNDPLRPGKTDRVIAASFALGSTQTFATEVDAYHNYPQVVIALKNATDDMTPARRRAIRNSPRAAKLLDQIEKAHGSAVCEAIDLLLA